MHSFIYWIIKVYLYFICYLFNEVITVLRCMNTVTALHDWTYKTVELSIWCLGRVEFWWLIKSWNWSNRHSSDSTFNSNHTPMHTYKIELHACLKENDVVFTTQVSRPVCGARPAGGCVYDGRTGVYACRTRDCSSPSNAHARRWLAVDRVDLVAEPIGVGLLRSSVA